jgi:hypothetical protein
MSAEGEEEMKRVAASLLLVLAAAVASAQVPAPGRAETRITLSPAIAAAPDACTSSDTVFCANNGRFAVSVVFSAPNLGINNANAHALTLTSDTGYFWFFSPQNVELVLKVVDGRAFNGFFWVFYGALSDVAYTVTVMDTQTAAVKTYTNPAGTLASGADTAAFSGGPSCTYTVGAPSPASFGSAGGSGTISVSTDPGCTWTAVSNSAFVVITSGASGSGSGIVNFSVAANASGAPRNGTVSVAGETVTITQAGVTAGQFDGSWSGTTSQACTPTSGAAHLCSLTWIVSNNSFTRLGVGFAGPACGVTDGFTTDSLNPAQPIVGNSFHLTTTATSPGVSATITLNGAFSSPTSAGGSGSVRITTSSPNPDCTTTIPISFTTIKN